MLEKGVLHIDFRQLLLLLFCGYAFSMPFELFLEYIFGIKTILKPFRVFSLLIISTFVLKTLREGLYMEDSHKTDFLMYAIFIYGILISFYRIITAPFKMSLLYNDLFQSGLHIATFLVFKFTRFTQKEGLRIFHFFVAGVACNVLYVFYRFVMNMQWGRQSGFTDNPNYTAFGIVAVLVFIALKINYIRNPIKLAAHGVFAVVLLAAFSIQGSRTGLLMLLVGSALVFFYSNIQRKVLLILVSSLILLILLPGQLDKLPMRGPTILLQRVSRSVEAGEEDVRLVIWRGVFRMLEDKGYMGLGIGQFKANFAQYYGTESNKLVLEIVNRNYYLSPHNDYLAILADYGLPSLILYLAFLGASLWKAFIRITYPTEDEDEQLLARFGLVFLLCIAIFGMAMENFQHQLYWFLLMFSTKQFD